MVRLKLTLLTGLFLVTNLFSQNMPPPPPFPPPGEDGYGTSGTGAPSSFIDQYLYEFLFLGILLILYVQYKIEKNKGKNKYTTS